MFKEKIKLKQHTPIIHFQHDQEGATLRATELKPKLDRYIIEHLKQDNSELYEKYKPLIVPKHFPINEKVASPYRLAVTAKKRVIQPGGAYFGDLKAVKSDRDIEVVIFSFVPRMAEFIKKVIPSVLVTNNFGCRQSKGFGCFTPQSMSQEEFEGILTGHKYFKGVYRKEEQVSGSILNMIRSDYQLLKSGINIPNTNIPYQKSLLFDYMCKQSIRWEKRSLKKMINKQKQFSGKLKQYKDSIDCDNRKSYEDKSKYDYKFVRALLGLAEQYEYLIRDSKDKYVVEIKHDPQVKHKELKSEELENEKIERIPSPIMFKVFKRNIYMVANPLPDIEGEGFNFELKLKKDGGTKISPNNPIKQQLVIPTNFSIRSFLESHIESIGYLEIF